MDIGSSDKPLGTGPKTRVCYICGRQYGVHSYDIHLKQCKELWIARESQKDPKERKKLPEDPALRLSSGGGGGGGGGGGDVTPSSSGSPARTAGNADGTPSRAELDELNKLASETFNAETLSRCAFCGRTFLAEKLAIHNRSCTADNPARRVNESVHKGLPTPTVNNDVTTPQRPHTSGGSTGDAAGRSRKVNFRPEPSASPQINRSAAKEAESAINLKIQDGHLVGSIGGASGRSLRHGSSGGNSGEGSDSGGGTPGSRDQAIEAIHDKIEAIESTVFALMKSLNELKASVENLPA